jgi:DNA-binding MarR family transcriptional regulator
MSTIENSNEARPSIGYVIGSTRRMILKVLGAEFFKHQIPLTIEQYIFLHHVRTLKGEATQQELANLSCKDKSAILRTIDTLENQGLVTRNQVAGDRRKNTINVTSACETLFREIFALEEEVFKGLTLGVSEEDYETTLRVLYQIQQNANTLSSIK